MLNVIEIVKGVHPGFFLERELKKRKLTKGKFALSIHEYPQTLSAIINGKRSMNIKLALRIEQALEMEEGLLMTLQVHHDIRKEKKRMSQGKQPALTKFRPALFWDTNIERIDWNIQKRPVIQRVFERGNFTEKKEVLNYYGRNAIKKVLAAAK